MIPKKAFQVKVKKMRLQAVAQQIEANLRQKWRAKKLICHDQRKNGPYRNKVVLMKCHSHWMKLGTLVLTLHRYNFLNRFVMMNFSVVDQLNFHSIQRSTKEYEVAFTPNKKNEMKRFLGIILFMGNHKLPNRGMYLRNFTHVLAISTTMPQNKFDEVIFILHFNDNTTAFSVTFLSSNKLY